MFLIDKYRPNLKEDSEFHGDVIDLLEIMSKDDAIPHLILYGPDGAGKRTIINIFLEMLFGEDVRRTKDTSYEIVSSGGKKTIEKIKQSNHHIEINPKGTNYDRYLIHDIVKEYARSNPLNKYNKKNKQFKLVLINNVDNLSPGAQMALRRTMEIYSDKCRFVMWCKSLSKLIKELQSRCIKQRIPAPTNSEIFRYIFKISVKENISLTLDEYSDIIIRANGNIKYALWELQFKKFGYTMNTEYLNTLDKIVELLLESKIENITDIRESFFHLMITNYTGTNILIDLINKIYDSPHLSKESKQKIVNNGANTEYRLMKGRRDITHLDAFAVNTIKNIYEDKSKKLNQNEKQKI
jgi:replication factor C subunit 3/5